MQFVVVAFSVTNDHELRVLSVRFGAVTAFGVNSAACCLVTPFVFNICDLPKYMTSHGTKVYLLWIIFFLVLFRGR